MSQNNSQKIKYQAYANNQGRGHAEFGQGYHQGPYGYTTPALSSVASNSGHDINKPVATAEQGMYSNPGMPAPEQHHQSMRGPIASPQPIIQQGQQISRNPISMQTANAYYPRNSVPPRSMQSMARNSIGAVINQPGQQTSSQYGPMPTMVPLQPNFTSFPPTMVNPQFPQMYQRRAYNPPRYPIMASQKYLRNYNAPPPQNLNGYFQSHGISLSPQHTRKGANAIPIIDPKTGKNCLTVDKNAEDSSSRPKSEKESENSDSNICVQFAKQVAAVLNDSRSDIASKQPKPVSIDTMCSHENEGMRKQETPVSELVDKRKKKKTKKKKDLNKRGESKKGGEMDTFLDTKVVPEDSIQYLEHLQKIRLTTSGGNEHALGAVPSPVPPLPHATTTAPTSVSTPVSERNAYPVPIMDDKILNAIPLPGENPDTTAQSDISQSEPIGETSSVSSSADRPKQNKIVLKYSYKEHQWSPLNPEGKKQYDREFLLQLQSHPMSLRKLNNLPKLDVIKDKAHIQKLTKVNRAAPPVVNNPIRTYDPSMSGYAAAVPMPRMKKAQRAQQLSSTKVNPKPPKSMEEMKEHLLSLLEKNAELEEVFYWVNANVPDTSDPTFVRALVIAVHESCFLGSGTAGELNTSKFKSRIPLISRYVSANEKLQVQALNAAQALSNQLGQPSGLLHQIFDILYDEGVISDESLIEWEQSDDPNEAEKGRIIK